MTAYRVVDDHKELDNVGSNTHDQIDLHIDTTPFLVVSGAAGNVPTNARLLSGSGITITDNGPGNTLVIAATIGSTPGGSNTNVQFNDSGSLGGDASFTFDKVTNTLSVDRMSGSLTRLVDGSSYLVAGNNVTIVSQSNGSIRISSTGGTGSPGGLDTYVQFNDGGVFGGDSGFVFNKTTNTLTVNNVSGSLTKLVDGSSYLIAGSNVTISTGSNGSVTIAASTTNQAFQTSWMEVPTGDADGVNMIFTLSYDPYPSDSLLFYVNGTLQAQGASYDYITNNNVIIMNSSPTSGSSLVATYSYIDTNVYGSYTKWSEFVSGTTDGINTTFSLSNAPNPTGTLMLYINGVLQRPGSTNDYTISNNTISTSIAPLPNSTLLATYKYVISPPAGNSTSWMEIPSGSVDGINSQFTIVDSPNPASSLMFFVNGVLQKQGVSFDYLLSGSVITMNYIPNSGSNVIATYPY